MKRSVKERLENEDGGIADQEPLDTVREVTEKRGPAVRIHGGTHATLLNQDIRRPTRRRLFGSGSKPARIVPSLKPPPAKAPSGRKTPRKLRNCRPNSLARPCPTAR